MTGLAWSRVILGFGRSCLEERTPGWNPRASEPPTCHLDLRNGSLSPDGTGRTWYPAHLLTGRLAAPIECRMVPYGLTFTGLSQEQDHYGRYHIPQIKKCA